MGYDKIMTDSDYKQMSGSKILYHLSSGVTRVRVTEEDTVFTKDCATLARDKLKSEGYSVLEEGRYRRVANMNANKVLPKDDIDDFMVEPQRDSEVTYSFRKPHETGPGDSLRIRYADLHKKKRVGEDGYDKYYNTPTSLGLIIQYSRSSGNPDYMIFMKK